MAQMCMAGCRSGVLCVCACILLCWLTFFLTQVAAHVSYDRDQLFLIKSTVDEAVLTDYMGAGHCPLPLMSAALCGILRTILHAKCAAGKEDAVEASL